MVISIEIDLGVDAKSGLYREDIYKELVEEYASQYETNLPPKAITLYPVSRLGYSGARVFYINISNEINTYIKRLIGKFVTKKEAKQEKDSASLFPENIVFEVEHPAANCGLIVYKYVEESTEFRDFYLNKSQSNEEIVKCINKLYSQTVSKYIEIEEKHPKLKSITKDYEEYIELRSKKPLDKLKSIINFIENALCLGATNPYSFYYNELKPTKWGERKIVPKLIHGDLHARNIMVPYSGDSPKLIDFAWGHYGHKAKDFALLESTIKYMLLSEYHFNLFKSYPPLKTYISFEKQLCMEGLTLTEYSPEIPPDYRSSSEYITDSFQRAYSCIKTIRSWAKNYLIYSQCSNSGFQSAEEEYFLSLFLISLGNFAFPTVENIWLINGCGFLATEIMKYWK